MNKQKYMKLLFNYELYYILCALILRAQISLESTSNLLFRKLASVIKTILLKW